jgi:hypothetical protein
LGCPDESVLLLVKSVLRRRLFGTVSPSSLSGDFRRCPLRFYLARVCFISVASTKFVVLCVFYVMRVHYTFIVSLSLWPWSFMDFRGLFCIVNLRPLSLSSSLFADDFPWAMIFLRNA